MKKNQSILITGASTGIGRATALSLAGKGHRVYAGCRKQKDYEFLAESGCHPLLLDVTSDEDRLNSFNEISKHSPGLDALVNNAGIAVGGPIECVPVSQLREQLEINVVGAFAITQLFLPLIRKAKGRIINISSISGKVSMPFLGPYAASKYALEAITDSLRREVLQQGVQVISINPGPIKTPIWEKSIPQVEQSLDQVPEGIRQLYKKDSERIRSVIQEDLKSAAEVDMVVNSIEKALFSKTPKTRYFVGKGISAQAFASRLVPDRWLDSIILRALR